MSSPLGFVRGLESFNCDKNGRSQFRCFRVSNRIIGLPASLSRRRIHVARCLPSIHVTVAVFTVAILTFLWSTSKRDVLAKFESVRTVYRQNAREINTFSLEYLARRERVITLSLKHSLVMLHVAGKSVFWEVCSSIKMFTVWLYTTWFLKPHENKDAPVASLVLDNVNMAQCIHE